MTTSTAAAAAALRFDIVADKSQFTREVEAIRSDFKAAAAEMQESWAGIGGKVVEYAGRAWDGLEKLAEQAQVAIAGGAAGVEAGLLSGLEKVKEATQKFIESGLASLGEKWFGKIGERVGRDVGGMFAGIWDKIATYGAEKLSGDGPIGQSFQGLLSMIERQVPEVEKAFSFLGLKGAGDKVKETVEGIRSAIAVIKGEQLPIKDFEAILAVLQKQTTQYELQLELLGKTAAEIAKIRAMRALEAAEANIDGMGEDQRRRFEEKKEELGAAAQKIEDQRTGQRQANAYKQIVEHLERQVELENVKGDRLGLTIGQLAEQRAIEDAIVRMKRSGRELSEAELANIKAWALAYGHAADEAARVNLERTTTIGFERQAAAARMEYETIGMAIGPAAAYRAELQAIARFKEQMIPLSDEMRTKIQAESAALGEQVSATARLKESLSTIRDAGAIVARSLEGAFDKFISGTKVNFRELAQDMLAEMTKLAFRSAILQPLFGGGTAGVGMLGNLAAGMFKADGGPVSSASPYIVGERGPELFIPQSAGTIIPNGALGRGGGSVNMAMTINLAGANGDETIARIASQAARQGAAMAVQQVNDSFPARQRSLQLLGA